MKRFVDSIKNEEGFLTFEWSYLLLIFLVIIVFLLPSIITIGKIYLYSNQAAAYAIQRVSEQGYMTEEIATDVIKHLESNGIYDFELYGTGEPKGLNEKVEVKIIAKVHPPILKIMPWMRTRNSKAYEEGALSLISQKIDVSNVYIR
ncbi:hypothetical protein O0550_12900 [Brevibacillus halotolerans]|uniref:hypothetical protein n=1 Tax=Brevibacillus TaxID=55080 RepID=UPI00215BFAF8|nr:MULTISPECIES: hypothetical protein [Brevibacillus]MCR8964092.1 hypothetical protein [Brevibacillus laterosporus]MCZ0836247.1 hypothetical protein [Brevibacillus halotolerans]